jgi:5-methylcytosine-specific restriction enzyme subunit McrC
VWLRSLFEKAVRGFYRFHLRNLGWDVGVKKLNWHINYIDDGLDELLPSMKTDMILDNKNENRRVVIDTKFTSILKPGQFGSDTLRSGYLYQMYAYLMSQQDSSDPLDQNSSGILLHPEIGGSIDKSVVIQKKTIRFMTVNLAGTLEEMKRQLLSATNQTPIFR